MWSDNVTERLSYRIFQVTGKPKEIQNKQTENTQNNNKEKHKKIPKPNKNLNIFSEVLYNCKDQHISGSVEL